MAIPIALIRTYIDIPHSHVEPHADNAESYTFAMLICTQSSPIALCNR